MSSGMMPGGFFVIGQLVAPSGTRLPFHQAAAPLGWTQDVSASFSDCSFRVNNSSPSTGGSTAWSTWNQGGSVNFNAFNLTVAQMAAHNHGINGEVAHSHAAPGGFTFDAQGAGLAGLATSSVAFQISSFGTTASNSANISMGNAGSGASITPSITTPLVKYADMIIAIKS